MRGRRIRWRQHYHHQHHHFHSYDGDDDDSDYQVAAEARALSEELGRTRPGAASAGGGGAGGVGDGGGEGADEPLSARKAELEDSLDDARNRIRAATDAAAAASRVLHGASAEVGRPPELGRPAYQIAAQRELDEATTTAAATTTAFEIGWPGHANLNYRSRAHLPRRLPRPTKLRSISRVSPPISPRSSRSSLRRARYTARGGRVRARGWRAASSSTALTSLLSMRRARCPDRADAQLMLLLLTLHTRVARPVQSLYPVLLLHDYPYQARALIDELQRPHTNGVGA